LVGGENAAWSEVLPEPLNIDGLSKQRGQAAFNLQAGFNCSIF